MLRFKRIPRTFGFEVKLGETSQGNKPFHSEILKFELGPLSIFEPCPGTTFSNLVPDRFQNQFFGTVSPISIFIFYAFRVILAMSGLKKSRKHTKRARQGYQLTRKVQYLGKSLLQSFLNKMTSIQTFGLKSFLMRQQYLFGLGKSFWAV